MADYYGIFGRAISNLPKSSPPSTRQAIYDRARKALINQLSSLKPPLPAKDIETQLRLLKEASERIEKERADVVPPASAPRQSGHTVRATKDRIQLQIDNINSLMEDVEVRILRFSGLIDVVKDVFSKFNGSNDVIASAMYIKFSQLNMSYDLIFKSYQDEWIIFFNKYNFLFDVNNDLRNNDTIVYYAANELSALNANFFDVSSKFALELFSLLLRCQPYVVTYSGKLDSTIIESIYYIYDTCFLISNSKYMDTSSNQISEELDRLEKQFGIAAVRDVFMRRISPVPDTSGAVEDITYDIGHTLVNSRPPTELDVEDIIAHGISNRWMKRPLKWRHRRGRGTAHAFYKETYAKWLDKGIDIPSYVIRRADRDLYERLISELGKDAFHFKASARPPQPR
jgi:hypothetical protein